MCVSGRVLLSALGAEVAIIGDLKFGSFSALWTQLKLTVM